MESERNGSIGLSRLYQRVEFDFGPPLFLMRNVKFSFLPWDVRLLCVVSQWSDIIS